MLASDDISDAKLEQILFYGGQVKVPMFTWKRPHGAMQNRERVCSMHLAPLVTARPASMLGLTRQSRNLYSTEPSRHVFAPIGGAVTWLECGRLC